MSLIRLLDENTINQIAAGEVVERPRAVVKELIENAIDAGATAITAEIKEGGLSLIRITDNGSGISKDDIPVAFMRHATSKIKSAEDLFHISSLGFRGEALSSIAAVSQIELITKEPASLNGYRYIIEGGEEKSLEEIGCPSGTTIIVRNLFYNTPARRKFLKSPKTEAGYIHDLMEKLMVSHPGISFRFIVDNKVKLQTSGNNNIKDILYNIYGRDISRELLEVSYTSDEVKITGFIGKPTINRGNRNFENYFINGRYISNSIITRAIEDAYRPYLMLHKYPFTSIYYEINPVLLDVNVHPQKLELKLNNADDIYRITLNIIKDTLAGKELIPRISLVEENKKSEEIEKLPEPFEKNRMSQLKALEILADQNNKGNNINQTGSFVKETGRYTASDYILADKEKVFKPFHTGNNKPLGDGVGDEHIDHSFLKGEVQDNNHNLLNKGFIIENHENLNKDNQPVLQNRSLDNPAQRINEDLQNSESVSNNDKISQIEQMKLFATDENTVDAPFLSEKAIAEHRIIGQVFATYWLVEYKNELYIIDQHAAHEKVMYERILAAAKENKHTSQLLMPPIVLTLTLAEQETISTYEHVLNQLGYEIEHFGGNEYSLRAVPADLYGLSDKDLFLEFIDELTQEISTRQPKPESILEKTASMACKAAVKANHAFSYEEASALIKELLTLENPYNCPHGRPVIISMSQYELEKKFKRII